MKALDEFAPIVKVQPNRRTKNEISQDSLDLIKERDELKLKAHNSDSVNDWGGL